MGVNTKRVGELQDITRTKEKTGRRDKRKSGRRDTTRRARGKRYSLRSDFLPKDRVSITICQGQELNHMQPYHPCRKEKNRIRKGAHRGTLAVGIFPEGKHCTALRLCPKTSFILDSSAKYQQQSSAPFSRPHQRWRRHSYSLHSYSLHSWSDPRDVSRSHSLLFL